MGEQFIEKKLVTLENFNKSEIYEICMGLLKGSIQWSNEQHVWAK